MDIVPDFVAQSAHIGMPEGAYYIENYITEKEEKELLEWIDNASTNTNKNNRQWISNFSRKVMHFGYEFDYNTLHINFDNKSLQSQGLPDILTRCLPFHVHKSQILLERINNNDKNDANVCARIIESTKSMDQCTVNEYLEGQGIRPHIETIDAFTDVIMSLSLLSPIIMDFRQKDIKKSIVLMPRSLLILSGKARYEWSHGIAHRKYDIINGTCTQRQRRVSLTYRTVLTPKRRENMRDTIEKYINKQNENKKNDSNENENETENDNPLIVPKVEQMHVHKLYDAIAPHFSHTRHSGWPQVIEFLKSVSKDYKNDSVLLGDLGCGNGKYLKLLPNIAPNIYGIGIDFSRNLCQIVAKRGCEAIVSDALLVPFKDNSFEAVISIAVLHHISSETRRLQALNEIFRVCKSQQDIQKTHDNNSDVKLFGRGFICAWAYEQDGTSRHSFNKEDVLVPWALDKKYVTKSVSNDINQLNEMNAVLVEDHKKRVITFQRYCHVYKKGELELLIGKIANIVDENGNLIQRQEENNNINDDTKKYNIEIVRSFYNKGNWCVEFKKH